MTMSGTPESFEQLISAAMASGDYKPVWARFVRTRFFTPMHQPGQNAAGALRVLPGPKDGKPLLMVTQEREKLAADTAPDASLLSGAEIVRQLTPGVAIGVVLGKGVFTIPAKLVDSIRSKLGPAATPVAAATGPTPPATTPGSKFPDLLSTLPAINLPLPDATPAAPPVAGNSFPSLPPLNAALDPAPAANAAAQTASATPSATTAPETPAPAAADWDDDLVDLDLLPSKNPAPAAAPAPARPAAPTPVPASSQWQILGDDHASPAAPAAPVAAPLAPLAPIGGKKPTRPLDVQALKPRNVVHAGTGMDFYVPDAWQQRTGSRSLTFFDPASGAKIEVNSMSRSDTPLEKWLEIRLPTVTKEMPFLKQVGESYAISGPEWRGKISAMVTEFQGTYHLDQEETHYLICCYRTDSMVATITVRVKSDVFEENRAVYKWLFEQVDIVEPMPVAGTGAGSSASTAHAPAPALFALNPNGRIGRLRFLAYSVVMYIPMFLLILIATRLPENLAIMVGLVSLLGMIWLPIRLIVLRMHDFNMSGKWLWTFFLLSAVAGAMKRPDLSIQASALFWLAMIPVTCWPGDNQENRFGEQNGPNPLWVKITAGLFFAIQVMLVVAVVKVVRERNIGWGGPKTAEQARQSFSPPDNSFSVELPGKPLKAVVPERPDDVEDMYVYTLNTPDHKYLIESVLFFKTPPDENEALTESVAPFLTNKKVELVSEKRTQVNGIPAHDIRYRLPNGIQRDFRIMFKGRRFYTLMIETPSDKDDQMEIDQFLDSIRLN